jgi:hypothetical protein
MIQNEKNCAKVKENQPQSSSIWAKMSVKNIRRGFREVELMQLLSRLRRLPDFEVCVGDSHPHKPQNRGTFNQPE